MNKQRYKMTSYPRPNLNNSANTNFMKSQLDNASMHNYLETEHEFHRLSPILYDEDSSDDYYNMNDPAADFLLREKFILGDLHYEVLAKENQSEFNNLLDELKEPPDLLILRNRQTRKDYESKLRNLNDTNKIVRTHFDELVKDMETPAENDKETRPISPTPRVETELLRCWRAQQLKRLEEKDSNEKNEIKELYQRAQNELAEMKHIAEKLSAKNLKNNSRLAAGTGKISLNQEFKKISNQSFEKVQQENTEENNNKNENNNSCDNTNWKFNKNFLNWNMLEDVKKTQILKDSARMEQIYKKLKDGLQEQNTKKSSRRS